MPLIHAAQSTLGRTKRISFNDRAAMEEEHWKYVGYIQDKYFRSGMNTHLDIHLDEDDKHAGELRVKWSFTFQDLGMTHYMSPPSAVVVLDPVTGVLSVNGTPQCNIDQAEHTIFAGHYSDYVRGLYRQAGIQDV